MSFILLGILNAQAEAGAVGDYELLETTILGSDQATVSFTSLNSTYGSTYKHLQVRFTMRSSTAGTGDGVLVKMNGSNADYEHQLEGNGSTVTSSANSGQFDPIVAGDGAASGVFSGTVIDILDAFGSNNKTMRAMSGSATLRIMLTSGLFIDTNPVDSLTFDLPVANIMAGSRFSIYGIKAA